MAEGEKISALPLADTLTGAEQIPFAKTGANGRLTVEQLKGFVTDGMDLSGLTAYDDTVLKGRVSDLEQAVQANADAIAANLDNIEQAQAEIEANQERISENLAKIEQANADKAVHEQEAWSVIVANTAKTKENEESLALKANSTDVYTKSEIDNIIDAIPHYNDEPLRNRVSALEDYDHNPYDDSVLSSRLDALESYDHPNFIKASDLPSLEPYATIEFVQEELTKLVGADSTTVERLESLARLLDSTDDNILGAVSEMLNGYFTKEETNALFVSQADHDDEDWAKKSWCMENFETKTDNAQKYALKSELEPLAKATDIPEISAMSSDEILALFNPISAVSDGE